MSERASRQKGQRGEEEKRTSKGSPGLLLSTKGHRAWVGGKKKARGEKKKEEKHLVWAAQRGRGGGLGVN